MAFNHAIMQVTEIAFTGYPVTNMKRAREFYEGLLGLKKSRDFGQSDGEDEWVEYDIGAGCIALFKGDSHWTPSSSGCAAALEVDDFQGFVDRLRSANVKFMLEPTEGSVCWMTVVADPDGNRVVIHRRKAR